MPLLQPPETLLEPAPLIPCFQYSDHITSQTTEWKGNSNVLQRREPHKGRRKDHVWLKVAFRVSRNTSFGSGRRRRSNALLHRGSDPPDPSGVPVHKPSELQRGMGNATVVIDSFSPWKVTLSLPERQDSSIRIFQNLILSKHKAVLTANMSHFLSLSAKVS